MNRNINNSKLHGSLLLALSLVACNGGNSSSSTSEPSPQLSPLQQYIGLLKYSQSATSKQLSSTSSFQQSFSTPGSTVINSVTIKYFAGSYCSESIVATTTLNGPATPAAGTYYSSNASNYALCTSYSNNGNSGCNILFNDVSGATPKVRSMQYTYNLESGVITSQCLYNSANDSFVHGSFEAMLNYSQTPPVACSSGSSCGYSTTYSTNSLFTQISLPQTGQLLGVPSGCAVLSESCVTSPIGSDGYGRSTVDGLNIPYGVAWAYNGTGIFIPSLRFTADPNDSNCIIDNLTGLEWSKNAVIGFEATDGGGLLTQPNYANTTLALNTLSWNDTLTAVANMNNAPLKLCGYTDWRLPNINELASLDNPGQLSNAIWLTSQGFSFTDQFANYWSSTSDSNDSTSAWFIYFISGSEGIARNIKTTNSAVWPVRRTTASPAIISQTGQTVSYAVGDDGALQQGAVGTNSTERFVSGVGIESACLLDRQTGLMWPKNGVIGYTAAQGTAPMARPDYQNTSSGLNILSWDNALSAVANMNGATDKLCGHDDWRLPNRNEFRSLMNYGQSDNRSWLSSLGFNSQWGSSIYWLSDIDANNPSSRALYLNVIAGSVGSSANVSQYNVMPVRGGQ